ncbi:DUF6046 domain-containing protein [Flavobacterium oreochromis]|uniref:DUF6046 domain-containing protein n=1 Tax=Flavobacterium oreochromis TaxID=2906078 RepID=UPI000CDB7E47|nr:hypothetical protein BWK58_06285 [Flavobacterium columnare]
MKSPIQFQFPDAEQFAKGAAQNLLFRIVGKRDKFLQVDGENAIPRFESIKELEGVPFLTSVALRYKGLKDIEIVECIMTINQERNIVTTPLQGRDGTIKEYISDGDYSITLEAGINNYKEDGENVSASYDYPKSKVEDLCRMLEVKDALQIQSDFLDIFNIKSVVVKNYNLIQETHSNRQGISISLLSDAPYQIKLKQDDVKAK